ncbi:RNA-directed DNA polymerase [Cellulosimicrobium cellulans]|uniref:RNA-directed DNA polymerase n=1 Tax=Cellulosimicrobium cellulans TaxID=1710 RepID=UPI00240611A1|nr:RNA-directed DNA polymerase [Cellulosimicrobium cellulans]MDF9875263.1 hypothetical protein [Cellulosimicrobium cellulans]
MPAVQWERALDVDRAASNLRIEFVEDWYRDPWSWPELEFLQKVGRGELHAYLDGSGSRKLTLIDVPKENWGVRPAVVLDILDRLAYQALVDRISVEAIGALPRNVYGWRLPPADPERGVYSKNSLQWDVYRSHLESAAYQFDVALVSDIVSFFASIPVPLLQERIEQIAKKGKATSRLLGMLEGFDRNAHRTGIPQRSFASAVLANMYVSSLDDVLEGHSSSIMELVVRGTKRANPRTSWTRWMDDIWLFGDDGASMRSAQLELQSTARSLGLHANSAKTRLLEGPEVWERAMQIEHSAIDEALDSKADEGPLEELVDRLFEEPAVAGRTSLKFAVNRMLKHGSSYRVIDMLDACVEMPHGADILGPLFRENFVQASLQDWLVEHSRSEWAAFEWSTAHYLRMISPDTKPGKNMIGLVESLVSDPGTSAPLLAMAAHRLARWDPDKLRGAARASMPNCHQPLSRRILAFCALASNEARTVVRDWLKQEEENLLALKVLESSNYGLPKVSKFYSA